MGDKIGLALSGGGYRAAAFHLGTLRTLNKLGMLGKVGVLSTVSGGSIVGASYALALAAGTDYGTFEKEFILKLKQSVIRQTIFSGRFLLINLCVLIWLGLVVALQFTPCAWIGLLLFIVGIATIVLFQFKIFPASRIIERVYNRIFFNDAKGHELSLKSLPEMPLMAINSTNLETGRQFTFSRDHMGDSTYDYPPYPGAPIEFLHSDFPIARAVMASSCVPFAFTPVPVEKSFFKNPGKTKVASPALVDGGIFDNQGLHKLTQENSRYNADLIIVSDAGNKMPFANNHGSLVPLLIRVMDVFMRRIKNFQIILGLYKNVVTSDKQIAYVSLGWNISDSIPEFVRSLEGKAILQRVIDAHKIPPGLLSPFNAEKICAHLRDVVGYADIHSRMQNDGSLNVARNVGTNLTALSDAEINSLISHAELLTELQIKLYIP